jgi:hypothetical protein
MYVVPFDADKDGELVRLALADDVDAEGEVALNVVDANGEKLQTLLWVGPKRLLLNQLSVETYGFKVDSQNRLKVERAG